MRYIEPNPHKKSKAEVVIDGVPVWALAGYMHQAIESIDQTAHDYDLPAAAVVEALAYYYQHREVIDDRLEANR